MKNSSMIIEIDENTNFTIPKINEALIEQYNSIDILQLMERIDSSDKQRKEEKESNGFLRSNTALFDNEEVKVAQEKKGTRYKIRYLRKVSKLFDGASFGELALIESQPRAATIISVRNTHFAVLNKKQFNMILRKVHEERINK